MEHAPSVAVIRALSERRLTKGFSASSDAIGMPTHARCALGSRLEALELVLGFGSVSADQIGDGGNF